MLVGDSLLDGKYFFIDRIQGGIAGGGAMDDLTEPRRQLIEVRPSHVLAPRRQLHIYGLWLECRVDAANKSLDALVMPGGSNCRVTDLGPGQATPMVSSQQVAPA